MDFDILFTLYGIFKLFIVIMAFKYLYKYLLYPYWTVKFYRAQGGVGFFGFGADYLLKNLEEVNTNGDWYFWFKELLRRNPAIKFFIRNIASSPYVILNDSSLVKEFAEKQEMYEKDPLSSDMMNFFASGSLFFCKDKKQWTKKKMLLAESFDEKEIRTLVPTFAEGVRMILATQKEATVEKVNILQLFTIISGEMIGRFCFGPEYSEYNVKNYSVSFIFLSWVRELIAVSYSFWNYIFGPKFIKLGFIKAHRSLKRNKNVVWTICSKLLNHLEQKSEKNCLFSRLIQNSKEKDPAYTRDEIIGEFINLFGVGSESISRLLLMAVIYLDKDLTLKKKIEEEINQHIIDEKNITYETINNLTYLDALIKETLRLSPPLASVYNRVAKKDHVLGKVQIKKGTLVSYFPTVIQNSEAFYSKGKDFVADRWIKKKEFENDGCKNDPLSYIPFGTGPKACPAEKFSITITKIVLAVFLKKYDYDMNDYELKMTQRYMYEPLNTLTVDLYQD